jgi:hypothetical protein
MLKRFVIALLAVVSATAQTVTINVHTEKPGTAIPNNFLGFSMEIGDLASTSGLNLSNPVYRRMVAQVAPGLVRFSGNSADKTGWQRGTRTSKTPANTLVSSDVDNAFAFARATGYQVLFGLNFATGTPATAADEAAYMFQSGGSTLYGFEIGNEPDGYAGVGVEPSGYTAADYINGWPAFANAIQAATPKALLAGPATMRGDINSWTAPFVQQLGSRIAMVTHHLYGIPEPNATIATLLSAATLQGNDKIDATAQALAAGINRPWRMDETNSVGGSGGLAGVSTAFASGLWLPDYLFTLANRGAAGANVYGDGSPGNFSPIVVGGNTTATARPLYYGMLLFKLAAQGNMVPLTLNAGAVNLTAYGTVGTDKTLRVTVINKDASQNATVQITPGALYTSATVMRLTGLSLSDTTGSATLGGVKVAADGSWTPTERETVAGAGGVFTSTVPSGSAALFTFAGGSIPRPLHGRPRVRP